MRKIWFSLGLFLLSNGVLFGGSGYVMAAPETSTEITPSQESERAAYLDPEQKKQAALAETLKEHELVWLDVNYPDVPEVRKVLAIAKPSLIAEKQGAILLIHDKEQHADWPEIIHPLRTILPKYGWFTLSVNLPDETRIKLPEREIEAKTFDQLVMSASMKSNMESGVRVRKELEGKNESTQQATTETASADMPNEPAVDNAESVDIDLAAAKKRLDLNKIPYDIRALKHIEKAYAYLQSESYQNIVIITYGQSAELAVQYLKAHQGEISSPGFALILIEPSLPEAYLLDLSEWIGKDFRAPVLDIIDKNNLQAVQKAEYRRMSALRAGAQQYKQLFLTVNNNDIFDESLSRRIRSWLESNAPGMQIGK
jgi:hypothetical protein